MKHALLTAVLLLGAAAPASAQDCTAITSIPTTITTSGRYCLTQHLAMLQTTGDAITVAASYVSIDLKGFELAGAQIPSSTSYGIRAVGQTDITIRNGTLRGFYTAVSLEGSVGASRNHLVENLRVHYALYSGLRVSGQTSIVRSNEILGLGGTTAQGSSPTITGIAVFGNRNVVEKNVITGFPSGGSSIGIIVNPSSNTHIDANHVMEAGTGIYVGNSSAVFVTGNQLTAGSTGVLFWASSGKYRDNLTIGFTNPYLGGTDAGNNQ